jgi:hypothetical protein
MGELTTDKLMTSPNTKENVSYCSRWLGWVGLGWVALGGGSTTPNAMVGLGCVVCWGSKSPNIRAG